VSQPLRVTTQTRKQETRPVGGATLLNLLGQAAFEFLQEPYAAL